MALRILIVLLSITAIAARRTNSRQSGRNNLNVFDESGKDNVEVDNADRLAPSSNSSKQENKSLSTTRTNSLRNAANQEVINETDNTAQATLQGKMALENAQRKTMGAFDETDSKESINTHQDKSGSKGLCEDVDEKLWTQECGYKVTDPCTSIRKGEMCDDEMTRDHAPLKRICKGKFFKDCCPQACGESHEPCVPKDQVRNLLYEDLDDKLWTQECGRTVADPSFGGRFWCTQVADTNMCDHEMKGDHAPLKDICNGKVFKWCCPQACGLSH